MSFSNDPIIKVNGAEIYQDFHVILRDVQFEIEKGEFVYLIGPTGSGKSTLLKALYADTYFDKGDIQVAGFDLNSIKHNSIPYLRRKLGIIFQDFELFTDRSVFDNLEFVLQATGWKSSSKIKQRISDVLMRVGLESSGNKFPYQLSGGEQQRIVIARALLNEPVVLLADEPTGNLDPHTADSILQLFNEINNSGTAILMATHNHHFLTRFPQRFLHCNNETVQDSAKEEIDLSQYSY